MENKTVNCACGSCEDCETCSLEEDSSNGEESEDKQSGPVALRDYRHEIDAYLSYLLGGAFGKLYKKDAKPDSAVYSPTGSTIREHMWVIFSTVVGLHLKDYATPQYGDFPNDTLSEWTPEQCISHIRKYASRFGTNSRGQEEDLTDLLKIAHYASVTWMKLRGYEDLFKVELPEDLTHEELKQKRDETEESDAE